MPKQYFNDFVEEAKYEAYKSNMRCKHGAVVVKNGNVISRGFNKQIVNCKNYKISIHAEVDAISNCYPKTRLNNAVLFVVRISSALDGELMFSKPCKHCTKYLKNRPLAGVYYSISK